MIAALIALRDFFVVILMSWLGIAADTADTQKDAETAKPSTASVALVR